MAGKTESRNKSKRKLIFKIAGIAGTALLAVITALLLINSLLCIFIDHYYPTFGDKRLFAIVSDSMEPEIPTGHMIVSRVPESQNEIQIGTVITYEMTVNKSITLITHRVTGISYNERGEAVYTTRGDNAGGVDSYRPVYSEVVGIYTGKSCAFFGYFFGFLQSSQGAIALMVIALIIVITAIIVHFVNMVNIWRSVALEALKKSNRMLNDRQPEDMATVADVLGIVMKEPSDSDDLKRKDKKLNWFIETGTLPRRPYYDDLDEYLKTLGQQKAEEETDEENTDAEDAVGIAVADESDDTVEQTADGKRVVYNRSFTAKLMQSDDALKGYYSDLKNALLSYGGVRCKTSWKREIFRLGKSTVASFSIRGKTLRLCLASDPVQFEGTKYKVDNLAAQNANIRLPLLYKIKNARRAKYAGQLIDMMFKTLSVGRTERDAEDYSTPYISTEALIKSGLIRVSETPPQFFKDGVDKNAKQ